MNIIEIEAELLNSEGPEFEKIMDADSDIDAMFIAGQFFAKQGKQVNQRFLSTVVDRIRRGYE